MTKLKVICNESGKYLNLITCGYSYEILMVVPVTEELIILADDRLPLRVPANMFKIV